METTDIINMLAEFHEENPQNFEFNASMLLAGDANKTRRQTIIKIVTGKDVPKSKAGYHAVINVLKQQFTQTKLF